MSSRLKLRFQCGAQRCRQSAIRLATSAGAGLAISPSSFGRDDQNLVQLVGPVSEIRDPLYVLVHRDLKDLPGCVPSRHFARPRGDPYCSGSNRGPAAGYEIAQNRRMAARRDSSVRPLPGIVYADVSPPCLAFTPPNSGQTAVRRVGDCVGFPPSAPTDSPPRPGLR